MATETKRVYDIQVNGTESFNELRQAIEQLNDKLKTLNETSKEYSDTLAQLTEYQKQLADAMQGISTSAEKTDTSLTGIKNTVDSVANSISNLGEDVINSFTEGLAQGMAEAATNTEQMGESTEKSINSVKDLKQEIADLRDRLVTLDKGSDDYKATVQELIDAQVKLKEVMNAGKNETQAAEGSYNALSQRMSALKQVWKEATDEATRDEIGKQIAEINAQLKGMDASIGNFQRNVGNYQSALDGLDTSFVKWKQELRECKEALEQLDPSTQEYADTMARASEITHLMADQQEMIKYSSADLGDQLNNIRGIASNLAAGYSAVNAAMGLFGGENEEVAQALLKVQQAMALVQGLQGIDGFIKRTKGLSQSMGLVTKATQANTVATKANAAASKADAVAKGAEAVATEAAVPAQLSLNAAMKANPIGFIIGLIASLIAIFSLLKDKIMEMIGANDEMSAAFDKVKAVLSGFGNVIKKSIVNPIKLALIPLKTLGKIMVDIFKGDWSKIGDDFKEGMTEMKDTAIDTINVVGQFKEGYDKKTAEQAEAARKKEAEERAKDKDDYIKDMEAKNDSNWKFTAEGKKAYEEYYKALLEMYDKDSEEYKQALRDKESYLRDFNQKAQENAENLASTELKLDVARYGEQVKYGEKWYNYEKKLYQDAMKLGEKYRPPYANIEPMPPEVEQKLMESQLRWEMYLKARNDYYKKQNEDFDKKTEKLVADFKSKFDSLVDDRWKSVRGMMETLQALNAELKVGSESHKAIDEYIAKWRELFESIGDYDEKTIQTILYNIKNDIEKGAVTNGFENYIKAMKTSLDKTLYDMDKSTQTFVNNLELMFEDKKLTFGIQFPEDEMNRVTEIFNAKMDNANFKAAEVRERIDLIYETLAQKLGATTEVELAAMLPGFKKLLEEEQNYCDEVVRLNNEMVQKVSDIRKKAYDMEVSEMQHTFESQIYWLNSYYNEEQALADKRAEWSLGTTEAFERPFKRERELIEENLRMNRDYYNEIYNTYIEMSQNLELTAEERNNALLKAEEAMENLRKVEAEANLAMQKSLAEGWKTWVNSIKSTISSVADSLSTLNDAWSSMIDLEREAIETELKNGDIREDEAKRREEENKKSFENLKKFQIAQAIINTLASAVSAYQSMASIPYVGPVLGAVAAAAALASGYAQVKQIQATEYGSSSSSSSSGGGGSTNFQLPDVMATEPELNKYMTGMDDTDSLNNAGGNGNGKGLNDIRVVLVESDVTIAQKNAKKVDMETTF